MKKIIILLLTAFITACSTPAKQPPEGYWSVRGNDIWFCFKQSNTINCSRFPKHSFIEPALGTQF